MDAMWVILDYTDNGSIPEVNFIWNEKYLFEAIDNAKNNNRKIVVYQVGKCVLDWS